MRGFLIAFKSGLMGGVALIGASAALAQADGQPAADTRSAEEAFTEGRTIVVTAQRREQNIQDVPIAITAIEGEELARLGAAGFSTFADRVPGLQASQPDPLNTQFSIRGTSSGPLIFSQLQQSSTVGIYFDEVAVDVSAANPNFPLIDVNRVEVLRGPQGTLFGAGSQSGVIRTIPNQPDMDAISVGGSATGSFTNEGGFNQSYDAGVNIPIIEGKLALRAIGYAIGTEGFTDNIVSGEKNDNDFNSYGGRAILSFDSGGGFDGYAMFAYQDAELDNNGNIIDDGRKALQSGAFNSQQDESIVGELVLRYDFGSVGLTAISGYVGKKQLFRPDAARLPVLFGLPATTPVDFPTNIEADIYSQEVRLQSTDSANRFRWLIGGFYQRVERVLGQEITIPGIEVALGFPAGPAFGLGTDQVLGTDFNTENEQVAVFAEFEFDITDRLTLTAGGRYFDASQDSDFVQQGLLTGGVFPSSPETSDSGFNPNFVLNYEINKRSSVYARAAKGFRLGGTNFAVPSIPCATSLAALGLTDAPQDFASDSLWSYELGTKNVFAGGVTVNAAGYYSEWSDIQTNILLPCGFNFQSNGGRAEIMGGEVEIAVPISRELSIFSSFTYTDATFQEAVPTIGIQVGERAPFTPEIAATFGVDYRKPLSDSSELFFNGSARYQGERFTGVTNTDTFTLDEYVEVDTQIGIEFGNDMSVYVFASNLFDNRSELNASRNNFATTPGLYRVVSRPRTVGLTVRRNF